MGGVTLENYKWQYDENLQVGTDYNDLEEIAGYDERMSRFRDVEGEIEDILDFLNLDGSATLTDLGCGTGRLVLKAAEICREVSAVDVSKSMLEYVENRSKKAGLININFSNAGFLNHSYREEECAVVSQLALHHLPDFWKMVALRNIFVSLKVGGKFYLRDVVFSIPMEKYKQKIDGFLKWTEESAGEENAANYARHIKQEYSTFDWIMEEMLYRAGFYIEEAQYSDSMIAVYKCVKPRSMDF